MCSVALSIAGDHRSSRETSEEVTAIGYESTFELLESEVPVGYPCRQA